YRIELGEIESVLREHPMVQDAVVVVRQDAPGDKRIVAYVVPCEQSAPPESKLRERLQEKLPEYMIPAAFAALSALPLNPSGKLDRKALPAPEEALEDGRTFVAPRTEVEDVLAGIWAQVLRVEQVGVHDNFFGLGGDSILAIQVISKAKQANLLLNLRQ